MPASQHLHLRLFDGNGIELAASPRAGGPARLKFTFLVEGTYFFGASARGAKSYDAVTGAGRVAGEGRGSYRLNATPVGTQPLPADQGRVPPLFPYDSQRAAAAGWSTSISAASACSTSTPEAKRSTAGQVTWPECIIRCPNVLRTAVDTRAVADRRGLVSPPRPRTSC